MRVKSGNRENKRISLLSHRSTCQACIPLPDIYRSTTTVNCFCVWELFALSIDSNNSPFDCCTLSSPLCCWRFVTSMHPHGVTTATCGRRRRPHMLAFAKAVVPDHRDPTSYRHNPHRGNPAECLSQVVKAVDSALKALRHSDSFKYLIAGVSVSKISMSPLSLTPTCW